MLTEGFTKQFVMIGSGLKPNEFISSYTKIQTLRGKKRKEPCTLITIDLTFFQFSTGRYGFQTYPFTRFVYEPENEAEARALVRK